jgi:hypothetical protein
LKPFVFHSLSCQSATLCIIFNMKVFFNNESYFGCLVIKLLASLLTQVNRSIKAINGKQELLGFNSSMVLWCIVGQR